MVVIKVLSRALKTWDQRTKSNLQREVVSSMEKRFTSKKSKVVSAKEKCTQELVERKWLVVNEKRT